MLHLYNINALVHWTEAEIEARERILSYFASEIRTFLRDTNPAWNIRRVEAPLLVPRELISSAYTREDVWFQERMNEHDHELVLRPETTPSTYVYMQHLLSSHQKVKLPLCVWQAGKSFRREQDQVLKNMRLKEFFQAEWQCAYTSDTQNDYHAACLEPVRRMIASAINAETRVVPSDRLPAYSQITTDVEAFIPEDDRWMEVASISRRMDFPEKARFTNKRNEMVEKDVFVLEIAIGLDRCVYNWNSARNRS